MQKTHYTNRIYWIIPAFIGWYIIVADSADSALGSLLLRIFPNASNAFKFVLDFYTPVLGSCIVFLLMCAVVRKNRFLLGVVKPTAEKRSMGWLGIGLLLGFLTNFFCIICALLHGDIRLTPDYSAAQIPVMLFALLSVFIQSTSEELWCRVFLYERINVHYPLWVAIVVNGVAFGLLHIFNDGLTPVAMADLIFCGFAYSLLRWYTGSPWACFGIHTMWNFTQNFMFGLPNSSLVSECSMFRLDAANGMSNWAYSYEFGVEGALPAVFIDLVLAGVILYLAKKDGRLGELKLSREQTGEVPPMQEPPARPRQEEHRETVEFIK